MYKYIVFALVGCSLSLSLNAQRTPLESILQQVEQNNLELKAFSERQEGIGLDLRSGNNLPDPQFGLYYLPFGEHSTGDYTEYQLTQSIEFPTIYGARAKLIDLKTAQLQLDYQAKRQEILSQAKRLCLNLIYLQKRKKTENQRTEQAQQVYEQVQELYNKDQVGILELNKAKVVWMQEQFKIKQLEADIRNGLNQLTNLNGGNEIEFLLSDYVSPLMIPTRDSLWQDKLNQDPELVQLRQQELISEQSLSLANQQYLPNITAGYNSQGVAGERFSGIYAGVSIPLWSNRHKVQSARSDQSFQESFAESMILQVNADFEKLFNDYQLMLAKYQEYENTLSALNSDQLLFQAYRLGELSFLEYYMELQFYREAYDAMLEMEYQLYISQNQLLKHQL